MHLCHLLHNDALALVTFQLPTMFALCKATTRHSHYLHRLDAKEVPAHVSFSTPFLQQHAGEYPPLLFNNCGTWH
jgi:hypothetical protein